MEGRYGVKAIEAANRKAWRNWLAKNHFSEKSVWLIIYHKDSGKYSLTLNKVAAAQMGVTFDKALLDEATRIVE